MDLQLLGISNYFPFKEDKQLKKIIFTHLLDDRSGAPKVLSQVILAVTKKSFDFDLYTGGEDRDGFLSSFRERHYYYFYRWIENKFLRFCCYLLSQVSLFFKLIQYSKQDVIIYVNALFPFGAALAGKILGKPVIYHVHETSFQSRALKSFLRFIVQTTAKKVIFVSRALQERESFINLDQIVLYNALSDEFVLSAGQSSYHWRNPNFNVLMVCSLKIYKGINELIDVAEKCINQKDIRFTLVLNAEEREIKRYFSGIELPSNVCLVSRQTNLVAYYQQASLLLNLSRVDEWVETFGLTIIEAMAFGVPVIVPPVGGPVEVVTDGVEGYLISSYDTEKISQLIVALSGDEVRCKKLSLNAKNRAKDFTQAVFDKEILRAVDF